MFGDRTEHGSPVGCKRIENDVPEETLYVWSDRIHHSREATLKQDGIDVLELVVNRALATTNLRRNISTCRFTVIRFAPYLLFQTLKVGVCRISHCSSVINGLTLQAIHVKSEVEYSFAYGILAIGHLS